MKWRVGWSGVESEVESGVESGFITCARQWNRNNGNGLGHCVKS